MSSKAVEHAENSFRNQRDSTLSDPEEILFRRFSTDDDDERQMGELAFNNAFLGKPFDVICRCKRWFANVVVGPYVKYQPDNVHVAVHQPSGRLAGYLTGSTGGEQFEEQQYNLVRGQVVSLAASLTMPWTLFDQTSLLFAAHVIFKGESERPVHPQAGVHWHFQVAEDFRGRGIGTRLLQRFIADAVATDYRVIWAEVSAYPEKPAQYFERRGWSIFDAKPTGLFGNHVDFPVETLCITKPLSAFEAPASTPA